jgi:hypothetical protein
MISIKLYYDPLVAFENGKSRMSCQIGAQEFQHYVNRSQMLTVECMFGLDHPINQTPVILRKEFEILSLYP